MEFLLTPFDEKVKKYAEGLDIKDSKRSNTNSDDGSDNKSYGYDTDKKHSDSLIVSTN